MKPVGRSGLARGPAEPPEGASHCTGHSPRPPPRGRRLDGPAERSEQQPDGPARLDLGKDALPEQRPGRARAGGVGRRHFRLAGDREPPMPRSRDAPSSSPLRPPAASSCSDPALLLGRASERGRQALVLDRRAAPALDALGRLDAGDRRDEIPAGQVVRRREGRPVPLVGILFRYGRQAAARRRGGRPAEPVPAAPRRSPGHPSSRSVRCACRQSGIP